MAEKRTHEHAGETDPGFERTEAAGLFRRFAPVPHLLPSFIILGAQKAGTTSLYEYLMAHPCVGEPSRKEVHFFDVNFHRGTSWYRRQFPTMVGRWLRRAPGGQRLITGEATPYYLFHPFCPERAAATVPEARLIAILRNPVDRAYSHYRHSVRLGRETLGFEEAIDAEPVRLAGEAEKLRDPAHRSLPHQRFSYVARGEYATQLEAWAAHFPRERLLVLRAEDLFKDPGAVLRETLAFLGLPAWEPPSLRTHNAHGGYDKMPPAARERLAAHFAPHNRRLYEFLGRELGW